MEDIIPEPDHVNIQRDGSKETTKPSKRQSLPVFLLSEMIAFCGKIYTELGKGAYHSKDLIAQVHNVVYDSIKQKFSTAQSYGLLELKFGVGYKLTDLFLKIYKPETDKEKREGIIESLRTPEFYSKLIDEFNGDPLPSEQGLSARLIRNFQIKDYAADKAAQIFLANLRDNGLVGAGGNLNIDVSSNSTLPLKRETKDTNGIIPPVTVKPPNREESGYIEIPVPLNGGKRAYIKIPEDYKPEDCERIAKFVEALK